MPSLRLDRRACGCLYGVALGSPDDPEDRTLLDPCAEHRAGRGSVVARTATEALRRIVEVRHLAGADGQTKANMMERIAVDALAVLDRGRVGSPIQQQRLKWAQDRAAYHEGKVADLRRFIELLEESERALSEARRGIACSWDWDGR